MGEHPMTEIGLEPNKNQTRVYGTQMKDELDITQNGGSCYTTVCGMSGRVLINSRGLLGSRKEKY